MLSTLYPYIEQFAIDSLISKRAPMQRKNKVGLGLMIMSGIFCIAATIFGFIAGYGWLLEHYEQPMAAGIAAASTLVAGLVLTIIGYFTLKRKSVTEYDQSADIQEITQALIELANDNGVESIQDNPKTALIISGIAGFIAGEKLR